MYRHVIGARQNFIAKIAGVSTCQSPLFNGLLQQILTQTSSLERSLEEWCEKQGRNAWYYCKRTMTATISAES